MIEIKHLVKRFGSFAAVDGISFNVARGEVLGFLGPNGAGKSTTMKMITGYLTPTSGTAVVAGHDVARDAQRVKEVVGYLPEGAPAYPDMTPHAFLNFVASVRGLKGSLRKQRIDEVVRRTHLEGVMRQSIETLSKGYKRRVGLAQALLHDPEVLIMDEPTDGLDPNQKHEVRALIQQMAPHKAIVLSTHILEEVEAVCTRAVVIARGKIVADGTPTQLRARSRYHNAVTLVLRGVAYDAARTQLSGIRGVVGVEHVSSGDGCVTLTALAKNREPIAHEIAPFAREKAWQVEEIRVEGGRLDEVFREVTAGSAKEGA